MCELHGSARRLFHAAITAWCIFRMHIIMMYRQSKGEKSIIPSGKVLRDHNKRRQYIDTKCRGSSYIHGFQFH